MQNLPNLRLQRGNAVGISLEFTYLGSGSLLFLLLVFLLGVSGAIAFALPQYDVADVVLGFGTLGTTAAIDVVFQQLEQLVDDGGFGAVEIVLFADITLHVVKLTTRGVFAGLVFLGRCPTA